VKILVFGMAVMAVTLVLDSAFAQQQPPPPPVPLTEWRAGLDSDLSKLSMPRDAHMAIFSILQAYERQAMEKMKSQPKPEEPK
jgi:hypothetical protein